MQYDLFSRNALLGLPVETLLLCRGQGHPLLTSTEFERLAHRITDMDRVSVAVAFEQIAGFRGIPLSLALAAHADALPRDSDLSARAQAGRT